MRTQVIPAQITTVEDKIAGNLNGTQLLLLMVPIFGTTIIYALITPQMHITLLKIVSVLFLLIVCIVLSLRIKGKVMFNWLILVLAYNTRPKFYVANKNDTYLRTLDLLVPEKRTQTSLKKAISPKNNHVPIPRLNSKDLLTLQRLVFNTKSGLTFKTTKKGGLHVAFNEIQ